jgi:hypothetical protein
VLIVLKCGILKLLAPSRPVQACNGIALPLDAMVTHSVGGNLEFLCKAENIERSITVRMQQSDLCQRGGTLLQKLRLDSN